MQSASETRQSRVPPEKLRFVRDYRAWGASDHHFIGDDANRIRCCPIGDGLITPLGTLIQLGNKVRGWDGPPPTLHHGQHSRLFFVIFDEILAFGRNHT